MSSIKQPRSSNSVGPKQWLQGAVGYQIYVRSFADSTGDGIGDIAGLIGRMDYLKWLGVDIVVLAPFYPSPGYDGGDTSFYCDVDPRHGSLGDIDALIERVHELDMRVVFDVVPSHTSSQHRWFKAALADPTCPERDYYLFRDPKPDGTPPNNWVSQHDATAWTFDQASGQYFCHLSRPEQPDLNWRNPAVRAEFDAIYRFWLDRGVDGFRIYVQNGLLKHPDLPDMTVRTQVVDATGITAELASNDHIYDLDHDGNLEIYTRWQDIARQYDACLFAASGIADHHQLAGCTGEDAFDQAFFRRPSWMQWQAETLIAELIGLACLEPARVSWVLSCHDHARCASRFGQGVEGRSRAMAVTTLMFALGGVPFLFQGEELGSPNGDIVPDDGHDPVSAGVTISADRGICRTHMAWNADRCNGFSTAQPWLVSKDRPLDFTVAGQHANPAAPIHRYRRLISLRKDYPELWQADLEQVPSGRADVAVIQRGRTLTVANFGPSPFAINLGEQLWRVAFASQGGDGDVASGIVNVAGETTAIMVPAALTDC